jgi:hypothetical protein
MIISIKFSKNVYFFHRPTTIKDHLEHHHLFTGFPAILEPYTNSDCDIP